MARRPLFKTSLFPYHVTIRSNNKDWFYLPLTSCWQVFSDVMADHVEKYKTIFHAFTLMNNHLHLILTTPTIDLGETMRHLLTEMSRRVQKRAGRINHIFGTRYKWSILDSAYSIGYVYKYVLRNPVRAGICEKVEDYPFNSLRFVPPFPPIVESIEPIWDKVPKDLSERLRWLNTPTPKELELLITRGLKKQSFTFSKGNDIRKPLEQLRGLYGIE